jgi:hypothetical protein
MAKISPNSNATIYSNNPGYAAKAPGGRKAPAVPDDDQPKDDAVVSPTPGGDSQVTPVGTPFKPVNPTQPAGAIGGAPGEGVKSRGGLDALRR